jgi:hypothetical protein
MSASDWLGDLFLVCGRSRSPMSYEISSAIIPRIRHTNCDVIVREPKGVANENIIGSVNVYYFDTCLGWCPR